MDLNDTPIGTMIIAADAEGNLRIALFAEDEEIVRHYLRLQCGERRFSLEQAENPHGLSETITRYFAGELDAIDRIPVETGGTPFQREVWRALREIPCGTTTSYGALAETHRTSGRSTRSGTANGANPVAVVRPLPSRYRIKRITDRLRRRYRAQALAAGPREDAAIVLNPGIDPVRSFLPAYAPQNALLNPSP